VSATLIFKSETVWTKVATRWVPIVRIVREWKFCE